MTVFIVMWCLCGCSRKIIKTKGKRRFSCAVCVVATGYVLKPRKNECFHAWAVATGNVLKPKENEGFHVVFGWLQQEMY